MDVQALLVGIVAIAIGAAMMLLGYRLALILLPIWGFFAGFIFGAQVLQEFFGDGFLATTASWVVGVVVGLLFAVLSYLFWYVAVVTRRGNTTPSEGIAGYHILFAAGLAAAVVGFVYLRRRKLSVIDGSSLHTALPFQSELPRDQYYRQTQPQQVRM